MYHVLCDMLQKKVNPKKPSSSDDKCIYRRTTRVSLNSISPSFNRFPITRTLSRIRAKRSLVVTSWQAQLSVSSRASAISTIEENWSENRRVDTLLAGRGVGASARKNASAGPKVSRGPSYVSTVLSSGPVGRHASSL